MPVQYEGLSFERLGHAAVRIETRAGCVLYVDLWSDAVPDLDELPTADVVFVTHGDRAHYDPSAIVAVSDAETAVVAFDLDTSRVRDHVGDVSTLRQGETITVDGIRVAAFPAYNDPAGPHVDEAGNPIHPPGEGVGFRLTVDGVVVYVAGDTDFVDELREVTADVLLPPIGGSYTMDRVEAAAFARHIGADLVLPVHYNTDELTGVETNPWAFKEAVEADGARVVLMEETGDVDESASE